MRARSILLLFLAVVIAGGTAMLARSWLATQRARELALVKPAAAPKQNKSVLVAHADIKRGQILRAEDMVWQVWPEGAIDKNYVVSGGPKKPESFAGWVAKDPIGGGEPMTTSKIIAPGDRGFLAAVLRPGMRAISVPVTVTSGISGFIFPGDKVDLLLAYPVPKSIGGDYDHKAVETVLSGVRVIAIDQRLQSKEGEAVVAHTATFEVTPKESEIITLANEIGKLSLSLRSLVPGTNGVAEQQSAIEPAADVHLASAVSPAVPMTATPIAATPTADQGVTMISGGPAKVPVRLAQNAAATADKTADSAEPAAPGGGPRLVTPSPAGSDRSTAKNATYTIDSEISSLLPSQQTESKPPKLWICKNSGQSGLHCATTEEASAQLLSNAPAAREKPGSSNAEPGVSGGR